MHCMHAPVYIMMCVLNGLLGLHAKCSFSDELPLPGFGAQSPPLTDQIASVLRRYPDGGQILKVNTLLIM